MSKRISKCIGSFNYYDRSLIVLSATTGSISLVSFATAIGAPVLIKSASFSFAFSIYLAIVITLFKKEEIKRKSTKKLAQSQLNIIGSKYLKH